MKGLTAILFAAVGSLADAASGKVNVTAPEVYAACPGQDVLRKATDVRWAEAASMLTEHRKLRSAWGASISEAPSRVLWYAAGGDLETTRLSVVAVKDGQGLWHSSGVGDSVIWVQGAKPTQMQPLHRDLSVDESRRLDRVLADPCLYAGPTFLRDPRAIAGGLFSTLEIEIPRHHWRGSWHVLPTKQESDIMDLIGSKS